MITLESYLKHQLDDFKIKINVDFDVILMKKIMTQFYFKNATEQNYKLNLDLDLAKKVINESFREQESRMNSYHNQNKLPDYINLKNKYLNE